MCYLVPGPLPCPEVVAVFYIRPAEVPTLFSVERDAQVEQQNTVVGFLTGDLETSQTIWQSIRKRAICLRVQQFLFKAIHNTPMTGEVWFNIQGHHQRGICAPCGATENMEHILINCGAGHAPQVWALEKSLWPHKDIQWPDINMGMIMGCRCLKTKQPGRNTREATREERKGLSTQRRGATRLLQITVSEGAHLTWVLRCKRVIQEKQHSPEEVERRWYKAINRRLTDDKITATMIKREIPFNQLVEATWEDVLKKSSDPPIEWIHDCEVLVGRSE